MNVVVMFGGKSAEHEVSVITGVQVLQNIDKEKFEVVPIYVAKDGAWYTSPRFSDITTFKNLEEIPNFAEEVTPLFSAGKLKLLIKQKGFLAKEKELPVNVFFLCFHGGLGESGGFQGLFELSEIPYVGSGILGSALGMDKAVAKKVFEAEKIQSAPFKEIFFEEWEKDKEKILKEAEKWFRLPIFVKPARAGSSIGVTKVKEFSDLENAVDLAFAFDEKILVEEGVTEAREVNVSVMGNAGHELKVSECEEVFHETDFLSYSDKYEKKEGQSQGMVSTKRVIPAEISREIKNKIQELAKRVFENLGCAGLARVDFLYKEKTGEIFVIEINTIPGSMAFYLWEKSGISFPELTSELIDLAVKRQAEKKKHTTVFASNILKNFKPSLKTQKTG